MKNMYIVLTLITETKWSCASIEYDQHVHTFGYGSRCGQCHVCFANTFLRFFSVNWQMILVVLFAINMSFTISFTLGYKADVKITNDIVHELDNFLRLAQIRLQFFIRVLLTLTTFCLFVWSPSFLQLLCRQCFASDCVKRVIQWLSTLQ